MSRIDHIRIASPCTALWSEMSGDDRARFCGLCQKTVYDSMGLDSCELERVVSEAACVRVHRDASGRVLTRDRVARAVALAATAALAACSGTDTDSYGLVADNASPTDVIAEVQSAASQLRTRGAEGIAELANPSVIPEVVEPFVPTRPTLGEPAPLPPLMGRPAPKPEPRPTMGSVSVVEMGDVVMPSTEIGKIAPAH